ncbi:guanylate-binding protein 1-like isoform X3 [Eublepharis macularius]|uniref:Guanylate-binding protein 1-like isoform X3 n=1 Tax=Eublepharis macularius TaxID=481883 RepID=A0AA97LKM8_EUBMA|nr:guanylate-binding protein 1-like isoform X3 [Eublepharis macularius]
MKPAEVPGLLLDLLKRFLRWATEKIVIVVLSCTSLVCLIFPAVFPKLALWQRIWKDHIKARIAAMWTGNPHRRSSGLRPEASKFHMPSPMCLIENRDSNLVVCPEALQVLSKIDQPVVVVAIAGLYRTGKSFLMNKLAGKNKGFLLGSTVEAVTKGIWMWCVPYPGKPDQTLVLLDTEGLDDAKKGDVQNDSWIFVLAVLLSSTLVYNSMGVIDQHAIDQLHYVTELTERIKSKSSPAEDSEALEDSAEYVRFFPSFVWALRDFTLQLQLNGQPCTEDEYLEEMLKLKKGSDDPSASEPTDNVAPADSSANCPVPSDTHDIQRYNLTRECIRLFFPTRKCFIFDRPTNRKNLDRLEDLQDSELDPEFLEQAERFCDHIYETSKAKTVPGGNIVTGCMLAKLVETYVDTICSGGVPCVENAVESLARMENSAALNEAIARYVELMEQKVKLPTETLQELLDMHAESETEALNVFMDRAFRNDIGQSQAELMKIVHQKKEEYLLKNELKSSECCKSILTPLFKELDDRINQGIYFQSGGYQNFLDDLKTIKEQYRQKNGKGIMAEEVLQQFLKEREVVGKHILQGDEALTKAEKELADAKAKAEEEEQKKEAQKQELAALQLKLEDQCRTFEANIQQLKEKLERDREQQLEETKRMLDSKLREQKKFLEEGYESYASRLQVEMDQLTQRDQYIGNSSWIFKILFGLLNAITFIFPELLQFAIRAIMRLL